jgi:hypothetical protein
VIFDENYGIGLLNSSFGSSYNDPFDIIEDKGLTVPFIGILTNSSTSIPDSNGSLRTLTESIKYPDWISQRNGTSMNPCLP